MDLSFFLRGLVFGFSIAAPVGPIGVLCIRRTLAQGLAAGLVSGLGAATADALYGSVAAFGLTFIADVLIRGQTSLRLVGGLFLCCLGVKTFLTRPAQTGLTAGRKGLIQAYGSTFFLTLTNPLTILSFAAVFAGLGVGGTGGDYYSAGSLVTGVFLGSGLWWLVLSGGVNLLGKKLSPSMLGWVNRLSGAIITGFGVLALLRVRG